MKSTRARDGTPPLAVQIPVIAAVVVLTAINIWGRYDPDLLVLDVACGAVGCALLLVLFRRPLPAALMLAAIAGVSPPGATPASTLATLYVAQVRPFRTALIAAVAGAGGHLVQGLWRPISGLSLFWWILLDVAVHAALLGWGQWMQARRQVIWTLWERAQRAEAEQIRRVAEARSLERTRIAREMHDVLAHRLSLLATYAGALEYRPDSSPARLAQAASVIRTGAHQALDELREVIGVLRDDDVSAWADERPQPTLGDVDELVAESRAAGADVEYINTVTLTGAADAIPQTTGRTLYRLVQEGLTNARKHAAGQAIRIRVTGSPGESLAVEIGNRAPRGTAGASGTGFGLVGLSERVQLVGGSLDHGTTTDGRFVLRASLPWPT